MFHAKVSFTVSQLTIYCSLTRRDINCLTFTLQMQTVATQVILSREYIRLGWLEVVSVILLLKWMQILCTYSNWSIGVCFFSILVSVVMQLVQFALGIVHALQIYYIPNCQYPRWVANFELAEAIYFFVVFFRFYRRAYWGTKNVPAAVNAKKVK